VSPPAWVGFVAACAVGAPVRYVVDGLISDRAPGKFPWGTLVVNISGSALLGLLTGLALYHAFPKAPRLILGTGFCGAYTTFSTFTFETVRLMEDGRLHQALLNVAATALACAAGAGLGLALALALARL
jgi:CrcB protein